MHTLYTTTTSTPLGEVIVISNDNGLVLLGFDNCEKTLRRRDKLLTHPHQEHASHPHLSSAIQQLREYFAGMRQHFDIPLSMYGTDFQQQVWQVLLTIPYGTTLSYQQESALLGRPTATRAVANANGANNIAIIIPCHRVIATGGGLGGYSSGLERKQFLLTLEKEYKNS